jgi:hypothetical protein
MPKVPAAKISSLSRANPLFTFVRTRIFLPKSIDRPDFFGFTLDKILNSIKHINYLAASQGDSLPWRPRRRRHKSPRPRERDGNRSSTAISIAGEPRRAPRGTDTTTCATPSEAVALGKFISRKTLKDGMRQRP